MNVHEGGSSRLEHDLQCELQLPRLAIRRRNSSRAGIQSRPREDGICRVLEVRMVQNVERLRSELYEEVLRDLRNPEVLGQRVVQIPEIRSDDNIAARVSV